MAEYTVKLRRSDSTDSPVPEVEVDALTEFEAAAVGLNQLRARGEGFEVETDVEIVQGTVTETKPVPVKRIASESNPGAPRVSSTVSSAARNHSPVTTLVCSHPLRVSRHSGKIGDSERTVDRRV